MKPGMIESKLEAFRGILESGTIKAVLTEDIQPGATFLPGCRLLSHKST